jgi:hypothetical protein
MTDGGWMLASQWIEKYGDVGDQGSGGSESPQGVGVSAVNAITPTMTSFANSIGFNRADIYRRKSKAAGVQNNLKVTVMVGAQGTYKGTNGVNGLTKEQSSVWFPSTCEMEGYKSSPSSGGPVQDGWLSDAKLACFASTLYGKDEAVRYDGSYHSGHFTRW